MWQLWVCCLFFIYLFLFNVVLLLYLYASMDRICRSTFSRIVEINNLHQNQILYVGSNTYSILNTFIYSGYILIVNVIKTLINHIFKWLKLHDNSTLLKSIKYLIINVCNLFFAHDMSSTSLHASVILTVSILLYFRETQPVV